MDYLTKTALAFCLACLPGMVTAADIPSVEQGAQQYNKEMCVSGNTSDCIDSVCMNSSATDCPEQCKASAIDKCKALTE